MWDECPAAERQQLRVAAVERAVQATPPLPVPLRERHHSYQTTRVARFRTLLEKGAQAQESLVQEARVDVPPALRSDIWPRLLGISAESLESAMLGSELPLKPLSEETIKQISVDLPRCHQEHPVLASADGQACIRAVLEAWLQAHPSFAYLQGLDSLAAPFVVLHFHRAQRPSPDEMADQALDVAVADNLPAGAEGEAEPSAETEGVVRTKPSAWLLPAIQPAYCCLVAFTGRYLSGIFAEDGTSMLRAQLAEFTELLASELPGLASHFAAEGVQADFFAIPWLLTMFSHVLPIPHTLRLWDVLLAHADAPTAESLPLFFAIAVLEQSKEELLRLDFNGMLLYLARLPPVDLDLALRTGVSAWQSGAGDRV